MACHRQGCPKPPDPCVARMGLARILDHCEGLHPGEVALEPQNLNKASLHGPWGFGHRALLPRCQQTAPQKPVPAPLIPLPLISVPFEWVGMDLIGPLPKSAWGHEYTLVMVDYATRYPKAVPLWKATSRNVTRELLALFSRVGIPKDILTDQGTPFTS
ncbi:hypothetical protein QTP86_021198 [Hemibagrus guttatus]|nr:hypothetical protein QTP86_021198 [Hemibagrus guttatus]